MVWTVTLRRLGSTAMIVPRVPLRSEEHTLNSSHANISTLSLRDALPCFPVGLVVDEEEAHVDRRALRLVHGGGVPVGEVAGREVAVRHVDRAALDGLDGDPAAPRVDRHDRAASAVEIGRAHVELQSRQYLHTFPTRRSSVLPGGTGRRRGGGPRRRSRPAPWARWWRPRGRGGRPRGSGAARRSCGPRWSGR